MKESLGADHGLSDGFFVKDGCSICRDWRRCFEIDPMMQNVVSEAIDDGQLLQRLF